MVKILSYAVVSLLSTILAITHAQAERSVYAIKGECVSLEMQPLISKSSCKSVVDFSIVSKEKKSEKNPISLTFRSNTNQALIITGKIRNVKSGSRRFSFKFSKMYYSDSKQTKTLEVSGKCVIKGPLEVPKSAVDYSNTKIKCKGGSDQEKFRLHFKFAKQKYIKTFRQ